MLWVLIKPLISHCVFRTMNWMELKLMMLVNLLKLFYSYYHRC